VIGEQLVEGIEANSAKVLTFSFDPANFDGLLVLRAIADSREEILEVNNNNNMKTLEVFVRERAPEEVEVKEFVDLLVFNVELSTPEAVVGEEVIVTATVLNAGEEDSGPFTVGLYANSVFGQALAETSIANLSTLETEDVSFTMSTLELPVSPEIIVFADSGREIAEADEENNLSSGFLALIGEEMAVYYDDALDIGETLVFAVTDAKGKDLAGADIKITYPFVDEIRTVTVTTDTTGSVSFVPDESGKYSFTVSKPSYYSFFGDFTVIGPEEGALPFEFDMNIVYIVIVIVIIAGLAYYFLVIRKVA
jgi:hypothetical protein